MKVSELAKELKVPSDEILSRLKSLKLKAKGTSQELNAAVISVLKSELRKGGAKTSDKKADKEEKAAVKETKKTKKKTATKKAAQEEPKVRKPAKKKTTKKIVKKVTKKKKTVKKEISKDKEAEPKKDTAAKKVLTKAKTKISDQPFIKLKPLGKKRRKKFPPGKEGQSDAASKTALKDGETLATETDEELTKSSGVTTEAPEQETVVEEVELVKDVEGLPYLEVNVPITAKELSVKLQQKPSAVLKQLMQMGIFAHINMSLGGDIVKKLAIEFGFNVTKIKTQEEQLIDSHKEEGEDPALMKPRAPVVTFMGHVDHGKTTLLDKIRQSKVADSEHGGITQHIGAYSVQLPKGRIAFLDTPGHEAFTAMRARGAHITDLVVLVVAADEGIMPQTEEAIDHARAAEVPIVVAVNKIDRKNADLDRVKKQLADKGLNPEDWGGKTITVGVSAATGEGIDNLLEMILLEAELLELKANAKKKASGIVVEAHLSRGKGAVADLIVQSGTLKDGDVVVVGPHYGRIKAMFDDHERPIKTAGPSTPVEILGLPGVPEAGENFYVVEDERRAKEIVFRRQEQIKNEKLYANQKITLEDLYTQIQEGVIKELNVILKSDVQGSLEALRDSLEKIPSEEVKIKFIHIGVGEVNLSDVLLAIASKAIIIAFHVGIGPRAKEELEKHPVDVRQYRIIYDAVNDIKKALEGLLEPKMKKKFLSRVEVREVFKLSRSGIVAGCFVQKGKALRKAHLDLVRNGEVIHSGKISSLKRFKDDVKEVEEGKECGIVIEGFSDLEVGDIMECYELERITRTL